MTWDVTYHVKNKTFSNAVLIEGLPGIANVGKIAVDFMIDEFKARKLCTFTSDYLPHTMFINDKGIIEPPKINLYYKRQKKGPDLLFLSGDVQPSSEHACHSLCRSIIAMVPELNITKIFTTGGIGLQSVPDNPTVYGTANSVEFQKELSKKKYKINTNIYGVVGPVMGVTGVLVAKSPVPAAALLAETFGHQMYLGVKGAKVITAVLSKLVCTKINTKHLGKEVMDFENEIMQKTKELLAENELAGAKPLDNHYIG